MSASSTSHPGQLGGNDDPISEDNIQSARADSPPPYLRTAFPQHGSGRWLDSQDTGRQGEIERNVRETNRVLTEMLAVQQAIQQELKEMTDGICGLIEELIVDLGAKNGGQSGDGKVKDKPEDGAQPKSASSTRIPSQLDGNDDATAEDPLSPPKQQRRHPLPSVSRSEISWNNRVTARRPLSKMKSNLTLKRLIET